MNRMIWSMVLVMVVGVIALSACAQDDGEEPAPVEFTVGGLEKSTEPVDAQVVDAAEADTAERIDSEDDSVPEQQDSNALVAEQVEEGELHFQNCAFRTGNNAVIAVTVKAVNSSGLELEAGDEVAVFTPDGQVCAGVTRWEGQNIAVTAWGDDEQTDEIDGLQVGDEMVFHIWDQSLQEEIIVAAASYELGDGIYTVDGIHAVSGFTLE